MERGRLKRPMSLMERGRLSGPALVELVMPADQSAVVNAMMLLPRL